MHFQATECPWSGSGTLLLDQLFKVGIGGADFLVQFGVILFQHPGKFLDVLGRGPFLSDLAHLDFALVRQHQLAEQVDFHRLLGIGLLIAVLSGLSFLVPLSGRLVLVSLLSVARSFFLSVGSADQE
jgi:hypothetical protein